MSSINRRQMLKLSSAASLAAAISSSTAQGLSAEASTKPGLVPQWEVFEVTLTGPSTGNPFVDVQLGATFSLGHRKVDVEGFYDGSGKYKIRFMPDSPGDWTYTTTSNAPELAGKSGALTCTAAQPDAHGPVQVRNTRHFTYADGTPFFPFGTTCYAWIHQSEDLQRETIESLRNGPFNKIRMCIFPKSYEYNHNEPSRYPFERDPSGKSDFTRPNPHSLRT